jgi:cytoskeletal protein CcmA (bactofilin family)
MFRKDVTPSGEPDKVTTIIGLGTEIKGNIKATGGMRIDGRVEGEIHLEGDLVVGEEGVVEAAVKTRNITIAGELRGNVEATGRIEIVSTGRLLGDIVVSALIINEGALFDGNCQMRQAASGERGRRKDSHLARAEVAASSAPTGTKTE